MKKHYFLTTALSGLTLLSGSMLCSCSDEQTTQAQSTEEKAPAAAAAKAATPVIKTATPQERAASFPALAYIPATANTYLAVNTEEIINTGLKICPNWEMTLPRQAEMVKSAALAFSEGNEEVVTTLLSAATSIAAANSGLPAPTVDPTALATDALQNFKPIYLSATLTDADTANRVMAFISMGRPNIEQQAPFLTFSESNGWSCISCKLTDLPQGTFPIDTASFGDTTITVAYRQIENAIVVAICNNPAELSTPASAKESVLGTIAADSLNSLGGKPGLFTASASAALQNALQEFAVNATFSAAVANFSRIFPRETTQKLSSAFGKLEQIIKNFPKASKPLAITAWQDGNVHLTVESDSFGSTFNTATTCSTAPKDTIFYAYGSGITNLPKADYKALIDAYFEIFAVISGKTALLTQTRTAIENNMAPVQKLVNSLDSGWNFSIDTNGTNIRPIDYSDETAGTVNAIAPRISFAMQLKDKAAFEQAVKATFEAIHNIAAEINPGSETIVDTLLATEQSTIGKADVYNFSNISKPQQGLTAGYAVSDTAVALGTDAKLTAQMATATANTAVAGWFCELNLSPIVSAMETELNATQTRASYYTQKAPDDYMGNTLNSHAEIQAKKIQDFRKVISMITGCKAFLITQDGKYIFHLQADTPCLK